MIRCLLSMVIALLLLEAQNYAAHADGGQVRISMQQGNQKITVFTSPTPICAGWADISVAIQNANTGELIDDAQILIELKHRDKAVPVVRAEATAEAATNKLLQAALVELPEQGTWDVTVRVLSGSADALEASFAINVAPPWPQWTTEWPWFCWPIVPVMLFIVHRVLAAPRSSACRMRGGPAGTTRQIA